MKWLAAWIALLMVAAPALAGKPLGVEANPCDASVHRRIPGLSIIRAEWLAADAAWRDDAAELRPPIGYSLCRIQGVVDGHIGVELWLPLSDRWNGKFLATGVGGEAGTYNYADMARGLRRGYATASTDAGHRKDDRDWALDPAKRRAFASTGNHRLTVVAKRMISAHFGKSPARSYFIGCSGGGREALKEVQAYPQDFDGVLAGGAGPDQLAVSTRLLWSQYVMGPKVAASMSDADWALVSRSAIAACDGLDGLTDGIIADPRACRFKPSQIACKSSDQPGQCLTPEQVRWAEKFYAPLVDENGKASDQGLLPGVRITQSPRSEFAFSLFGKVVHGDPAWDSAQFHIARDMAAARRLWPALPNDRTDLSRFARRGGKLIYYHGWMDPWILAQLPIAWFDAVARANPHPGQFTRLFMVPGMGHCRGGPGPDVFGGAGGVDGMSLDPQHDMLSALDRWVVEGVAPDRIDAAHVAGGQVKFTRPLCAFPAQARLNAGAIGQSAQDFSCAKEP